MNVKVLGVKEAKAALENVEKALRNKIIRKGLRAGAKIIQKEAKTLSPVGETGRMKKAIKVRASKTKKGKYGAQITIGEKEFTGEAFYGAFVEYGTETKEGKTKIKARETNKQAFENVKETAKDAVLQTFKKEIDAAAHK